MKNPTEELKRIIKNPKNNPVLIDANVISSCGRDNDGLPALLKTKRIEEIKPDELEKFIKHLSVIWAAVIDDKKVLTVEEVVKEAEDSAIQIRDMHERRKYSYDSVIKDALMAETRSSRKESAGTRKTLSKLNRYVSRLERIIEILEARSHRYKENRFLQEVKSKVSAAATNYQKENLHQGRVSETDIMLVSAAFYEALSHNSSPAVISNDRHIVGIANESTATDRYFLPAISKKLKERVKVYWNGEKSFP